MSINYIVNINKVNYNPKKLELTSSEEELKIINADLDYARADTIKVEFQVYKKSDLIILEGFIKAVIQQDSATIENKVIKYDLDINWNRKLKFINEKKPNSNVKYLDIETLNEEIEFIDNPNIELIDIIKEELLLNIDYYMK